MDLNPHTPRLPRIAASERHALRELREAHFYASVELPTKDDDQVICYFRGKPMSYAILSDLIERVDAIGEREWLTFKEIW